MSTKSHIYYDSLIEIYSETSEPQSVLGNFRGYNIYILIEPELIKNIKIEGEYLFLQTHSKFNTETPNKIKIWFGHIFEFDYDDDGLSIGIKGGSSTAKLIEFKNFEALRHDK